MYTPAGDKSTAKRLDKPGYAIKVMNYLFVSVIFFRSTFLSYLVLAKHL